MRMCLIVTTPVMFPKIYQTLYPFKKRKQRGMLRSVLLLDLSVCVYQPLEKSLIHTDPLLICPADTAATAKASVPPWQHDHSCFRQEWIGTPELSTLQSRIKWNMTTSRAEVWDPWTETTRHLSYPKITLMFWKMLNQYCFPLLGLVWTQCLIETELRTAPECRRSHWWSIFL